MPNLGNCFDDPEFEYAPVEYPLPFGPTRFVTEDGHILRAYLETADDPFVCCLCAEIVPAFTPHWATGTDVSAMSWGDAENENTVAYCAKCCDDLRVPRHDVPRALRLEELRQDHGSHALRWINPGVGA